jgi:hypothetical protein
LAVRTGSCTAERANPQEESPDKAINTTANRISFMDAL